MGEKRPPAGMLAGDVYTAVAEYARNTKNTDIIVKLANESKLNEAFRRAGQEIQSLSQLNPVARKLGLVKKAREKKVINYDKKKSSITNIIKKETKKVSLSKAELSWDSFFKEIVC